MFTSDMANEMEEILRRVAAGELTPQEALPLLDAAGAGRPAPPPSRGGAAGGAGTPAQPSAGDGATGSAGTGEQPAWGTPPGPRIHGGEPEPPTGPVQLIRINA